MSYIIQKADDFKFIHRILNTNIDGKRRVPFALRIIRGIGRRFANIICKIARVDPRRRAGELTEAEVNKVNDIIADPAQFGVPKWFLNNRDDFKDGKTSHIASNNLDTKMRENLERLKKIRSHRGLRHFWGLRVRGQHTKTTGRRGATVGVTKKGGK